MCGKYYIFNAMLYTSYLPFSNRNILCLNFYSFHKTAKAVKPFSLHKLYTYMVCVRMGMLLHMCVCLCVYIHVCMHV